MTQKNLIYTANTNTSPKILIELSNNPNSIVRWYVAGNPNTPPETLAKLYNDDGFYWNIAGNPNTPPAILTELSKKPDCHIRYNVARNPNTPPATLTKLSNDPDKNVSNMVFRHIIKIHNS
jgi:hypothetical protein